MKLEVIDSESLDGLLQGARGIFDTRLWAEYEQRLYPPRRFTQLSVYAGSELQAEMLVAVERSRIGIVRAFTSSYPNRVASAAVSCAEVLSALIDHMKATGVDEFTLGSFNSPSEEIPQPEQSTQRLEYVIDLEGRTEQELLAAVDRSRRQKIRKAEKAGVTLSTTKNVSVLRKLQQQSAIRIIERGGADIRASGIAESDPINFLLERNEVTLLTAEIDGAPCSAGVFSNINGRAYFHLSGHSAKALEVGAPSALLWHAIAEYRASGAVQLNLGGVSAGALTTGHPERGLHELKHSFGARIVPCTTALYQLSPKKLWLERTVRAFLRTRLSTASLL